MIHPKEKKERALGVSLSLKGQRCASPKCAGIRRPFRPGVHKRPQRSVSEYGTQLREKQKIRLTYGATERQMERVFTASRDPIGALERRLDNVVFRLGFAPSRGVARQFITHGHIHVNGKRIASPSHEARVGDVVSVRSASKENAAFRDLQKTLEQMSPAEWLSLDAGALAGTVKSHPQHVEVPFNATLVVEFYAK
ncbi:MAG: 30S ribosomal protein S4 [Candidatus Liptonbacteria bacterium]|nr:30S ribosomal protein S4 [Candidatus Liptonbacteria bacterium]